MQGVKRLLVCVLVWLWTAQFVAAQLPMARPDSVGMDAKKLEDAREAVQKLIDDKQVAGAILLVARHGKVVELDALGYQDADAGKPMKTDTIVRIYSMSKPITTVAAMMLVEEGKLQLDDPVSKYLHEFKALRVHTGKGDETVEAKREVTVRDLMRHTAGLTYGVFGNSPVDQLYKKNRILDPGDTLEDMVKKLGKIPLQYQPGTRWHYSVAVDVLGRLVEVASGKPFDEFLAERIFKPLDMKDTAFYVPADKLDRFAASNGPGEGGKFKVTEPVAKSRFRNKPKLLSGGGGLTSTAHDYYRFCQMMLNGGELDGKRLLKKETVAEMTRNQLPEEAMKAKNNGSADVGDGFGLGFGVRVGKDNPATGSMVGEYSWGGAASTHFWIAPRQDLIVIALEQYMPFNNRLAQTVKPIVYQAIVDKPAGRSR